MENAVFTEDKNSRQPHLVDVEGLILLTDAEDIEVVLSIADFANRRFVTESILRTAITPDSVRHEH